MGLIRMSPALVSSVCQHFIMKGQFGTGSSGRGPSIGLLANHAQSSPEVGGRLFIMKGTVPTDFSTLTSFNARAADKLMTFDGTDWTAEGGVNNFQSSQDTVNPIVITTTYVTASASGTATWFWWLTTPLTNVNTFNNAVQPYNQIIGTVGVTGSGADLEFVSNTITAGEQYRIFNLRLLLPEAWSF